MKYRLLKNIIRLEKLLNQKVSFESHLILTWVKQGRNFAEVSFVEKSSFKLQKIDWFEVFSVKNNYLSIK